MIEASLAQAKTQQAIENYWLECEEILETMIENACAHGRNWVDIKELMPRKYRKHYKKLGYKVRIHPFSIYQTTIEW